MGLRVVVLRLQNCGTTPYVLKGYPAIELLDENGDQLSFTPHQGSAGAFEAVTADALAVAPSKGAPAQHLRVTVDIGTTGRLDLTAWQEGTPLLRR